ncbi:MAG: periplasmic heavy metal sensor [Robiginitomaculum sp.]|nr:periplasmic heavy metal sensor [Robiginitomaculum sp.]
MSTDTTPVPPINKWIIALLISIAVNGLLAGLLLSKQVKPAGPGSDWSRSQHAVQIRPNGPRHLVRNLPPERRKQVMMTAMKNLESQGNEHPRKLFKRLRQAKHKTMRLLRAEELDTKAIEQSLAEIRTLNQKLAVSGDALMIEVLAQLTSAERKAAEAALRQRKVQRRQRQDGQYQEPQ